MFCLNNAVDFSDPIETSQAYYVDAPVFVTFFVAAVAVSERLAAELQRNIPC